MVTGSLDTTGAITPDHPDVIALAETNGSKPESIAKALRLTRANDEMRAHREWQRTREGIEPATPNLNSLREGITMTKTKSNSKTSGGAPSTPVEYTKNGKRVATKRPFALNNIAYQCTAGIASKDSKRLSTDELIKVLKKLGVEDPRSPSWQVTLPNGIVVGAIVPGADVPPVDVVKAVDKALDTPKAKAVVKAAAARNASKPKTATKSTAKLPVLDELMRSITPTKRAPRKSTKVSAAK